MIKFSIVTICLNAGNDLLETVKRSLEQTYDNFEIIIKDGLSTDGCVNKLPMDTRIKIISKKDTGIYDAMNQALEYITGNYVIFMNCGDKFYSIDTLKLIANCIKNNGNSMYYGLCYNRKMHHVNAYPRKITEFTCFRTMICHQSTIYSADIFKEKTYDTSYKILGDRELLWYLICKKKLDPTYIDEIIVDYKAGGECENEKYKELNRADQKRLVRQYFPLRKRIQYKIMHEITLPGLRAFFAENPKYSATYFNIVKMVYKLIGKKRTGEK